jgi:hypothetical protein
VFADLLRRIVYTSMVPVCPTTEEAKRLVEAAQSAPTPARPEPEVNQVAPADSDDEGEQSHASTAAAGGEADAGAPADEADSGAKHAAFIASLRSRGLLAALEAVLEHHATAAVRAVPRQQ